MTKTYKINGKAIQELESLYKLDLNPSAYWNVVQSRFNQLLEALSDKEEEIETGGWRIYKTKNGYWRYERNDGHYIDFKTVEAARLHAKEQNPEIEEPKQEECLHLKQKILHKLDGSTEETCRDCGKDIGGSKQSTSLKEAAISLLTGYKTDDRNRFEVADQILKLIQSHLVKETETLEPSKYVQMDSECLEGYNICKESIIKIINNIN